MNISPQELAKTIDYTLLKQDTTRAHISELCARSVEYEFEAVCINPFFVKQAAKELEGSEVKVCTVIGFPLGATTSQVKEFEAKNAIQNGASEIDFVINVGLLKEGNYEELENDIQAVVNTAKGNNYKIIVKFIIETSMLTNEEKVSACKIASDAGVDFVKTSTGFSGGGAKAEDVELLKKYSGQGVSIKASGGIKDLETAIKMLKAGASRLGTSAGVNIIREAWDLGN